MKIEKLKMTRMHNLFIIALSAMCVACGGKNQGILDAQGREGRAVCL